MSHKHFFATILSLFVLLGSLLPANQAKAAPTQTRTWQDAPLLSISGTLDLPGVSLNYFDGVPRAAIADSSGNYSFSVPLNWSGLVTPSKPNYSFSPASKYYANLTADQADQNYSPQTLTTPGVIGTTPAQGALLATGPVSFLVQFSTAMLADGTTFAANRASNYLLVRAGTDGVFQTSSCAAGLSGDDVKIAIDSAGYNPTTLIGNVLFGIGTALPGGSYSFFVCGSNRMLDLSGKRLNNGKDTVVRFLVNESTSLKSYTQIDTGSRQAVGIGDFNGDGRNDAAMTSTTPAQLSIYLQAADGKLNTIPVVYPAGNRPEALAVGDLTMTMHGQYEGEFAVLRDAVVKSVDNLRERTELVNGLLNIDSSQGNGTRIQVYIPLSEEAADRLHHAKRQK